MYRSSVRHKHKQIAHLLISSVGPRPKSHHQQRIHPLPALSSIQVLSSIRSTLHLSVVPR